MSDGLIWIVLLGTIVNVVLLSVLLIRWSKAFETVGGGIRDELRMGREEAQKAARELREELGSGLKSGNDTMFKSLEGMGNLQQNQLDGMTKQLKALAESNQTALDRVRTTSDSNFKGLQESNEKKLDEVRKTVDEKLDGVSMRLKQETESNQTLLDRIRTTLDSRVKELQEGNEKKLDEMRKTVDDKLHDALEKRLGESFKLVSDRLESVHKGLGEMQALATGVGDLKRVLTNVKARGTWAEVQLGAILEQILAPEQYEKNVRPKAESSETVEYAVRLPGPKDDPDGCVFLPIDSKFPQEDYLRLQEAAERADPDALQKATDALARTVRSAARNIHDKYLNPPTTTDFGLMFLATEGLYAEVLRQPALVEELQQRYRVLVAGPTTLAAILTSLCMGFQTLAIEQRATEVWRVLGAVKTEFGKFGEVLEKVQRQLTTASRTIEETGVRSRAMERRLRSVEHLPAVEVARILELPAEAEEFEPEELEMEIVPDDEDDLPF